VPTLIADTWIPRWSRSQRDRNAGPPAEVNGERPVPRVPMPLSRREYQVAEGLENSGIAKILFLSIETVRTHVKTSCASFPRVIGHVP
jgi:DNA-binding NarL/FixJ family response regulator